MATATAKLTTKSYKSEIKPVWCPGCGDYAVLSAITKALGESWLLEAALETPQYVRYIDAERRARLPDAVLTGTWLPRSSCLV